MSNEELPDNAVATANWALDFVSNVSDANDGQIEYEAVARVLDSTSKLMSQINEMTKIESEAKEKEAARLQQAEIDQAKIDQESDRLDQDARLAKQKMKVDNQRNWIEAAKVGGTLIASFISYYAFNKIFKMHKNDDFMTGTEKDALNQINRIRF